jgi:hypothetical protein
LYFDNYIVDSPMLGPGYYPGLDVIRQTGTSYRDQNRLAIAMYTLSSYALLSWDGVLIRYECADPAQAEPFERFVRDLFPTATIIRRRSDTQEQFQASLKILDAMPGDWVFVAGNTDHPIVAGDLAPFSACLKVATGLAAQHPFVSVPYSHLVEFRSSVDSKYPIAWHGGLNWRKLVETADYVVASGKKGSTEAIQIMHKRMLGRLINGKDYADRQIRRTDDMDGRLIPGHVMVVSKHTMADHYDGYTHHRKPCCHLSYPEYPPLFIPPGFFEGDIRVAYGFDRPREGWVNVNPAAESYSFQDASSGTDLKMSLEEIPAFWKARISAIEANPSADSAELTRVAGAVRRRMDYPWPPVPAVVGFSLVAYHRLSVVLYRFGARYLRFLRPVYRLLKSA